MPPIFDVDDTTLLFFESLTRAKHSATCFAHFGSFLGRGYYYVIFKMLLQRVAQCPVGEEQICGYRYLEAVETGGRWVPRFLSIREISEGIPDFLNPFPSFHDDFSMQPPRDTTDLGGAMPAYKAPAI